LKEVDVTAAKKAAAAPASKATTARKAAPAKKAASTSKTSVPQTSAAAGKKSVPTKNAAPKKSAPAKAAAPKKATAKKAAATAEPKAEVEAAPVAKAPAPVKKAVPAPPKRPDTPPYANDEKFLEEQRVLLLEERAIYQGQAVDLRAEADSLALEREPGDVQFDEESGEGGTVTVDRERNLALSAQAAAAVEEIDDALRKIDRKTYGGCERCFEAIPKARLRALPFARLCVACKSGGLSRR
jgi:DnaK suppressor protein